MRVIISGISEGGTGCLVQTEQDLRMLADQALAVRFPAENLAC